MTPTCWICGAALDAGGYEPLVRVVCRNCGQKNLLQRTFDHFVPVETLGAGGMGTVYKARDTQLERFVALKLLHKDLVAKRIMDVQLQQEARIAAAVNHPNVVQIFSLGMDHGQFYVVMELIDHGSLDDLIESQGRLPEHQVLDIGIQIARGTSRSSPERFDSSRREAGQHFVCRRTGGKDWRLRPRRLCNATVEEYRERSRDLGNAALCRAREIVPPTGGRSQRHLQPGRNTVSCCRRETANRQQHEFRHRVARIEAASVRVASYRAGGICADCARFAANDRT